MTEFENALQECLRDLERGTSNLNKCLQRHPKHARHLKPVLLTHAYLERARELRPSPAFKARARARLIKEMQAHPRKAKPFHSIFMQLASSLAAMVLVLLVTGTVYAQSALPGEAFYGWKLASEKVWRAASPDPVGTDLAIADRRVDELLAIGNEPVLHSETFNAYLEVTDRLKSEINTENEARILPLLDSQLEELSSSGIAVPESGQEVSPELEEPLAASPTPSATPSITEVPETDSTLPVPTGTSQLIQETPQLDPTDLPENLPTVEGLQSLP